MYKFKDHLLYSFWGYSSEWKTFVYYLSVAYSIDSSFSLAQKQTRSAEPLSRRPLAVKVWTSLIKTGFDVL